MKKLSLLLMAVAFLCPKVANAQDGKGSINFVPYVGVNYSDFSGDTDYYFGGTSGKVNFMAGMRFEFQITDKSAIIADVNYRRLGANLKEKDYGYYPDYTDDIINDPMPVEVCEIPKKITIDCISFGPQYKQNIVGGLSVRAGIESSVVLEAKYHCLLKANIGRLKDESFYNGNYMVIADWTRDDFEWYYGEEDADTSIKGSLSDNLKIAIPLGLTYDYKNFNVNATYHLPITNCFGAHSNEYYARNQAFDLTIGYRLPLRKR